MEGKHEDTRPVAHLRRALCHRLLRGGLSVWSGLVMVGLSLLGLLCDAAIVGVIVWLWRRRHGSPDAVSQAWVTEHQCYHVSREEWYRQRER